MARYEEVIDAVREPLGGAGAEEVREAVARAVAGLVLWLPREERRALADALPPPPTRMGGVRVARLRDGGSAEWTRSAG